MHNLIHRWCRHFTLQGTLICSCRYTKSNDGIRVMMECSPCSRGDSAKPLHWPEEIVDWLDSVASWWYRCYGICAAITGRRGGIPNCSSLQWASIMCSIWPLALHTIHHVCQQSCEPQLSFGSSVRNILRGCIRFWTGLHSQTMIDSRHLSDWTSQSNIQAHHGWGGFTSLPPWERRLGLALVYF